MSMQETDDSAAMSPKRTWVQKKPVQESVWEPVFKLKEGDQWSDASSLGGSIAGNHYEENVRDKLGAESREVKAALTTDQQSNLLRLHYAAMEASKMAVGDPWIQISSRYVPPKFDGETAQIDAVTTVECNLRSWGPAASVLFGPSELPAGTIVECSVPSHIPLKQNIFPCLFC